MKAKALGALFAAAVAFACNKSKKAEDAYVDVPGWACSWDADKCSCVRVATQSVPEHATHTGCNSPEYATRCVASTGMYPDYQWCTCMTGEVHKSGDGTSWVSTFKKGDGDVDVAQCPPPSKPRAP